MSHAYEVAMMTFCPVCDKLKEPVSGKPNRFTWRQATEEETTARAMSGNFTTEHCPDCGGKQSDRLAKYGERDADGREFGIREPRGDEDPR